MSHVAKTLIANAVAAVITLVLRRCGPRVLKEGFLWVYIILLMTAFAAFANPYLRANVAAYAGCVFMVLRAARRAYAVRPTRDERAGARDADPDGPV